MKNEATKVEGEKLLSLYHSFDRRPRSEGHNKELQMRNANIAAGTIIREKAAHSVHFFKAKRIILVPVLVLHVHPVWPA